MGEVWWEVGGGFAFERGRLFLTLDFGFSVEGFGTYLLSLGRHLCGMWSDRDSDLCLRTDCLALRAEVDTNEKLRLSQERK